MTEDNLDLFTNIVDILIACDNKDYDTIFDFIISNKNIDISNFMSSKQLETYKYVKKQCMFILCLKHNDIESIKHIGGIDMDFKIHNKVWFNHLNDEFIDILEYIVDNIKFNVNLQDNEGKILLMYLIEPRYFTIIKKLNSRYIVDTFLKDNDNKNVLNYTFGKGMLYHYYLSAHYMNIHKLPLLLMRIYQKDFHDFNYLLDNNVVSVKDKENVISMSKWKIFLNNDDINFDKVEDLDSILIETLLSNIPVSHKLEYRRFKLFCKKYNYYLKKSCEYITNNLKIKSLMYKGVNLLLHNNDERNITHNIYVFGFNELVI